MATPSTEPTILIVPGLRDHVDAHWQTLGEVSHLNPASGYGEWPRAEQFIAELAAG